MTRLSWDKRDYEAGLDRGVFYLKNATGEVWNGLTSVKESDSNTDEQVRYIDGVKTDSRRRRGEFAGTIEAFTYPDSFFENVLEQRRQQGFGLSYRTKDKIHLVYNILVGPTSFDAQQLDTQPFSWGFTTTAIPVPGARLSAHLVVDAGKAYSWTVAALEDVLYGSESGVARLPLPEEVLDIFEINSILRVIDNGDGTFTVTGPDEVIQMLDSTTFQIDWPSAVYIDAISYTLSSL